MGRYLTIPAAHVAATVAAGLPASGLKAYWVPITIADACEVGSLSTAPSYSVSAVAAFAARPTAPQSFEVTILERAVGIGRLRRRVNWIRTRCLVTSVEVKDRFRTVQPFDRRVLAFMVVRVSVAHFFSLGPPSSSFSRWTELNEQGTGTGR